MVPSLKIVVCFLENLRLLSHSWTSQLHYSAAHIMKFLILFLSKLLLIWCLQIRNKLCLILISLKLLMHLCNLSSPCIIMNTKLILYMYIKHNYDINMWYKQCRCVMLYILILILWKSHAGSIGKNQDESVNIHTNLEPWPHGFILISVKN